MKKIGGAAIVWRLRLFWCSDRRLRGLPDIQLVLVAREDTNRRDPGSLGFIRTREGRQGLPAWSARNKKGCCPVSAAVHRITAKRSRPDHWPEPKKKRIKPVDLDNLGLGRLQSVSPSLLEKVRIEDSRGSGLFVARVVVRLSRRRRPTGVVDIATTGRVPPVPENADEDRPG